jgi:hypothetical protein
LQLMNPPKSSTTGYKGQMFGLIDVHHTED